MASYKPITPARRFYTRRDFTELTPGVTPEKGLLEALPSTGARNSYGRITSRFRGGRHKRKYRIIDFRRDKIGIPATVISIEYDPNRSVNIALLQYSDGEKRYILAAEGLLKDQVVESGPKADIKPGCALPMENIPVGTSIHNIELKLGKGGVLVRSAGTFAQLIAKEDGWATIRLPSGEMRKVAVEQSGFRWHIPTDPFEHSLIPPC